MAAVFAVLGLPSIEAEENPEEDSHRPLINGAENEDEYEPNYSIQEDGAVSQVTAISFHQACCLPGVIPVRLAWLLPSMFCFEMIVLHPSASPIALKTQRLNICSLGELKNLSVVTRLCST